MTALAVTLATIAVLTLCSVGTIVVFGVASRAETWDGQPNVRRGVWAVAWTWLLVLGGLAALFAF